MRLRNDSRYPEDAVRCLVAFAGEGRDLAYTYVQVMDGQRATTGRAYRRVPRWVEAPASARYLVVLRIGPPDRFPSSNIWTRARWRTVLPTDHARLINARTRVVGGRLQVLSLVEEPYGGKRSPVVTYRDWEEGLLAIAAHEFYHIYQFKNRLPTVEASCEEYAAQRLAAWRLQHRTT